MNSAAILQAVEEVVLGTIGSVRTVPASTLMLGAYSQNDDALAGDAIVKARVEVSMSPARRTQTVGPETGNVVVLEVDIKIRFVFRTKFELDDAERRAARAACMDTVEQCRKALCWPPNLLQTSALVPTGLVSACLVAGGPPQTKREDFKEQLLEVEMPMLGRVKDAQPTA